MRSNPLRIPAFCAMLALLAATVRADEVSGYLPLNLAPVLEADVERLLVAADVPVIRRPIPLATIERALPAACEADEALCLRVQRELAPWLGRAALGMATFEAAVAHAANLTQPNQRGVPEDAAWQVSAAAYAQLGSHVRANVGGIAYRGRAVPTGSFLSLDFARTQLDIGYRDHWWSPLRDSSMLISTEAETLPSVTLGNDRPLTRLRLSYEAFVARLSESSQVFYQGVYVPGVPKLAGFHVSFEPATGLSLGASRLLQFGGAGRPESPGNLFRAFFNASAYDNVSPTVSSDQEFGNQQLSLTSALTVPGKMPMQVSVEYAAEDTFHAENYRFGNAALSFGIFLPKLRPNLQLRYEYSNWENTWYQNHLYGDGLTNYGRVLGNWAVDWRARQEQAGGQSHMLQLNWLRGDDVSVELRYRTAQNASYGTTSHRRAHLLSGAIRGPWRQFEIGTTVDAGVDMYGKAFGRLGVELSVTGDARNSVPSVYAVSDSAAPESAVLVERFVELGVMTGKLRYEEDMDLIPGRFTSESGVHAGVGVRRSVSQHSDLGARLEVDDLRGRSMLSVRALDYRYRFNQTMAATGFFGFSQYNAITPAHGYYLGAGAQWRNIRPGWDLNADLRYMDRINRDRVTAGEEQSDNYPDEFWSMTGLAVYLSRRF